MKFKHIKSFKIFELHQDTYLSALNKIKKSGNINRAINFRNTYKEITGEELDGEWSEEDYRNIIAISNSLNLNMSEIEVEKYDWDHYDLKSYLFKTDEEDMEYCIGTDEQADNTVKNHIEETVWAFNKSFLMDHISLENVIAEYDIPTEVEMESEEEEGEYETYEMDEEEAFFEYYGMTLEEYVSNLQDKCESGNEELKSMIDDMDDFVEQAIYSDGRGHFISSYDGNENHIKIGDTDLYFYRLN